MIEDDINAADWSVARTYLRSRFRRGIIQEATRRDLKRALVILSHAGDKDPWPKETEDFRWTVSQLLQVRVSEDLFRWTFGLSAFAAVVSIAAVVVSCYKH